MESVFGEDGLAAYLQQASANGRNTPSRTSMAKLESSVPNAQYVNNTLAAYGFPGPLNFLNPSTQDVNSMLNCVYALLQQITTDAVRRDEDAERLRRLESDINHVKLAKSRVEDTLNNVENELASTQARERMAEERERKQKAQFDKEREDLTKRVTDLQYRDSQSRHEVRRNEKEFERLKLRLQTLLMDRGKEKQMGIDMINQLTRDGVRRQWGKAPRKMEEDLANKVAFTYEQRLLESTAENKELRAMLKDLQGELLKLTNLQEAAGGGGRENDPRFQSAQFDLPAEMWAPKFREMMERKIAQFREAAAKLPAPGAAPPPPADWPDGMAMQRQLDESSKIIREQMELIEMFLMRTRGNGSFDTSDDDGDSSRLLEQQQFVKEKEIFEQQKKNFEEERARLTQCAIQLDKDRMQLQRERILVEQRRYANMSADWEAARLTERVPLHSMPPAPAPSNGASHPHGPSGPHAGPTNAATHASPPASPLKSVAASPLTRHILSPTSSARAQALLQPRSHPGPIVGSSAAASAAFAASLQLQQQQTTSHSPAARLAGSSSSSLTSAHARRGAGSGMRASSPNTTANANLTSASLSLSPSVLSTSSHAFFSSAPQQQQQLPLPRGASVPPHHSTSVSFAPSVSRQQPLFSNVPSSPVSSSGALRSPLGSPGVIGILDRLL
eukprot:gnl/Spiro4/26938_TR13400_c0_g1_i1.p1 gnl/Spiro4/26938_TR13400_c0_g1~~gnl/Spiro4/26938_TR13400_c0_g1_i1.p1  ORF type:complete len:674 (+),score=180.27 gnl/Spiro4/26938_TR13400_c0_g1_i1:41-2062(+)